VERVGFRPWGQHADVLASGTVDKIAAAHHHLAYAQNSPLGEPDIYGAPPTSRSLLLSPFAPRTTSSGRN